MDSTRHMLKQGTLFFLIYMNYLSDGLTSNPKLFADDTSLFSVVQNMILAANNLNGDLMKISHNQNSLNQNLNKS